MLEGMKRTILAGLMKALHPRRRPEYISKDLFCFIMYSVMR